MRAPPTSIIKAALCAGREQRTTSASTSFDGARLERADDAWRFDRAPPSRFSWLARHVRVPPENDCPSANSFAVFPLRRHSSIRANHVARVVSFMRTRRCTRAHTRWKNGVYAPDTEELGGTQVNADRVDLRRAAVGVQGAALQVVLTGVSTLGLSERLATIASVREEKT